jgi:hypothetical protein
MCTDFAIGHRSPAKSDDVVISAILLRTRAFSVDFAGFAFLASKLSLSAFQLLSISKLRQVGENSALLRTFTKIGKRAAYLSGYSGQKADRI